MRSNRLSPPDAARRRFAIVQAAIAIGFVGVMVATTLLLHRVEGGPQRALIAAAPLLLLLLWAWEFYRMIRDDDEMMQAFHLRVVALSAMLVLLGGTMWGVIERLLGLPTLPAFLLLPAYALVSGLVTLFVVKRP